MAERLHHCPSAGAASSSHFVGALVEGGGEGGSQVDLAHLSTSAIIEVDFAEGFKAIFLSFIGSVASLSKGMSYTAAYTLNLSPPLRAAWISFHAFGTRPSGNTNQSGSVHPSAA